jgi:putative oxidoreductase
MTTLFSTAAVSTAANEHTKNSPRASYGRVALWAGQFLLAAAFLMAGGSKFAGAPDMVAMFNAIGIGQWFRYVTATIEVGSAIALLVPALAPYGALSLAATMTAAVATHLFVVGGSPVPALVLGAGAATIAWFRRDQF